LAFKPTVELTVSFGTGHEDDYVIELATKVRKVLEDLVSTSHVTVKDHIPSLQLRPLQEAVAMDS